MAQGKSLITQQQRQTDIVISSQNWSEKYDLIPIKANSTPAEVTAINTPALSTLGRTENGNMFGIRVLADKINDVVFFFDAKWHKDQVRMCAQVAWEHCYWFTFTELKQFISQLMGGYYPSNKNLTPPLFMECLQEYVKDRMAQRYLHYSQLKEKPRPILQIEVLTGKSRKVAEFLCARSKSWHQQNKERLDEITAAITRQARQQEKDDLLAEERKKTGQRLERNKQLCEVIERGFSAGYAPNNDLYERYIMVLSVIKKMENEINI